MNFTPKTTAVLLFAGLFLSLFSCIENKPLAQASEQPPLIQPPIPSLAPSFTVFKVNAEEGIIYQYNTGSTIIIPPASLVDEAGNPIAGEVEMRYREFHTTLDVLLSGIPMKYDTAGLEQHFETAGMFELRAEQNGQEVFIDESSTAQVNMASFQGGSDYNFYRLDEGQRNWAFEGTRAPEVNIEKVARKAKVKALKKHRPYPLDHRYFAFNYGGLLDVYFRENERKIYANWSDDSVTKPNVLEKAASYGLRCMDFSIWEKVMHKGKEYPACMMVWRRLEKKPFPSWTKTDWRHSLTHIRGDIYRLTLARDKDTAAFTTRIKKVMPLRMLYAFSPEYWRDNYRDAIREVAREEERLKLEADVLRSFEIRSFGIYNWDRLTKYEDPIRLAATFDFGTSLGSVTDVPMVYYLPGEGKSVVKFLQSDWDSFNLVNDPKAQILSILEGKKAVIYSRQRFAAINRDSLRQVSSPSFAFEMEPLAVRIESAHQLGSLLGL